MHKVETVWVGVKINDDGEEEYVAMLTPEGVIPVSTSNPKMVEHLLGFLGGISDDQNIRTELRKFATYEVVERFGVQ